MKQLRMWGLLSTILLMCLFSNGQVQTVTITGTVKDSLNKAVPNATIDIRGASRGKVADQGGNFSISVQHALPLTMVVSSIGFRDQEIQVNNTNETLSVVLQHDDYIADVMVTGNARVPERLLETPASIERMSTAAIRNTSATNFYDALSNFKGVDMTTSSLTFKTVSTRGFNGSGNLRFNQLIDGMDNQAPGLSFSVGNIIGLTELDVDNVELLPGASSALYGSGGMNGTMLMTGKNPFKYQGLSVQYKQGINHISDYRHGAAPVFDGEIRYAKAFKEKFAFKIAAKYFKAEDWHADDSTNLLRTNVYTGIKPGSRASDQNYDGVNVFGDEASASMRAFAQAIQAGVGATPQGQFALTTISQLLAAGRTPVQIYPIFNNTPIQPLLPFLIPTAFVPDPNNPLVNSNRYKETFGSQMVSRQGYNEQYLVNYGTYNLKLTGGLFYKINKNTEASIQAYFGRGTTVYTGTDRYSLKNLQVGQYKAEVKSTNWFLRAYTTQENSGDSYTATTAAVAINRAWKTDSAWFVQYTGQYGATRLGLNGNDSSQARAQQAARTFAETGRFLPGTPEFQNAFNKAVSTSISEGGAKFADKTNLYHFEGQYNLSSLVKFADVLVGASYRIYHLNSGGTIFADTDGPINFSEYGAYLQVQKKVLKDVLKLTASGRFDKNENFKGRFTPRFSALVKVAKDNNIRLSYQVAYRFPSAQDQYINLQLPGSKLIGGLPYFNTLYNFTNDPAYTAESIVKYRSTGNPADLVKAVFQNIRPETVNSYELGYRGLVTKRLLIDVYGYITSYKNFIGRVAVGRAATIAGLLSPFTTTNYAFAVNSPKTIKSYGWGASAEYQLTKGYLATVNISGDQLDNVQPGFATFFNAPKLRYNLGLSNQNVYKHIGFNATYRWQDVVNWEGTFGSAPIPAYGSLDAHISYTLPKIKSLIKLGATNLLNRYYRSAFGNPYVGGLYYVSVGYNVF